MRISIVTPFFNGSRFFRDTVRSLLAQTHEDWEWLIVDDGSDPEELEALEAWCQSDDRIQWRPRIGDPKGANRCRNQGWTNASAKHILFLDSDDMLLPHCLEQRVAHSQKSGATTSEVPYFGTIAFKEGSDERLLWDDPAHPTSWLASLWSQTPPCQSSGPLWTKAALEKVGGWSEDIQVWQDIDIHQRAYFNGIRFEPATTSEPDILYRIHEGSLSHNSFHSLPKLKSRVRILHNALQHAEKHEIDAQEEASLARMTWSVFRNACTLRAWSTADGIIKASEPIRGISSPFLSRWKMASKMRAHMVPFIGQRLENTADQLFPKSKRSILTTPYP